MEILNIRQRSRLVSEVDLLNIELFFIQFQFYSDTKLKVYLSIVIMFIRKNNIKKTEHYRKQPT